MKKSMVNLQRQILNSKYINVYNIVYNSVTEDIWIQLHRQVCIQVRRRMGDQILEPTLGKING